LLRPHRKRPSGCRAAEERYELRPFQSTELHTLPLARDNFDLSGPRGALHRYVSFHRQLTYLQ
jgi:hypothetical protein